MPETGSVGFFLTGVKVNLSLSTPIDGVNRGEAHAHVAVSHDLVQKKKNTLILRTIVALEHRASPKEPSPVTTPRSTVDRPTGGSRETQCFEKNESLTLATSSAGFLFFHVLCLKAEEL